MKFGTKVLVTRGGKGAGNLRQVKGVLVGAHGKERLVRLEEDDPLDMSGWATKGCVGHWSASAVVERQEHA